jgi:hypothetical protein
MTKHTLTPDSITAAKALVSRLCENGHIRMSVPVDFARDEDMLICALIDVAEKSLLTPTPAASGAAPAEDGYTKAFYEIASVLGIGARADTPENVFRNEMLPRIVALACREASPATLTDDAEHTARTSASYQYAERADPAYDKFNAARVAFLKGADWQKSWAALASPQVAPAPDEQSAFEDWLEETCPSGDHEAVQRQWQSSSAYRDFCGLAAPVQVAPPPSLDEILNAYSKAAPEFDAAVLQSFVDAHPVHGQALLCYAQMQLISRPASREEVEQEEIDDDQMAASVESLHAKMADLRSTAAPVAPQDDARDAARYRFLRRQQWEKASLFVVSGAKQSVRLGTYCPTSERLDDLVDAGIGSDQQ